jgi:hypothetical protein
LKASRLCIPEDYLPTAWSVAAANQFRTMTVEVSSKNDSNIPVTNKDSRITKIGKYLRRSNLDEIPQIFNVLKVYKISFIQYLKV